jgi:hypothetical protein
VIGAGAGDDVELSVTGGLVEEVVWGSVEEPPICDHTNAPTRMTAITATHGTHEELLPVRISVARRSGSRVSNFLSLGSKVMIASSFCSRIMPRYAFGSRFRERRKPVVPN